jgi:integrase
MRRQGQGKYFYARFTVPLNLRQLAQNRRTIVWSLRTQERDIAVARAYERRIRTLTLLEAGLTVGNKTVGDAAADFLSHYESNCKAGRGGFSPKLFTLFRTALHRFVNFLPKRQSLAAVTAEDLDRFDAFRRNPQEMSKKLLAAITAARNYFRERNHRFIVRDLKNSKRDTLSPRFPQYQLLRDLLGTEAIRRNGIITRLQYHKAPAYKTLYLDFYAIKKFLLWCSARRLYSGNAISYELKKSPSDRLKRDRRSEFKIAEYNKLTSFMRRKEFLTPETGNPATEYGNHLLRCLVLFLANTGCRPGEIRHLQFGDIKTSRATDGSRIAEFRVKSTNTKVRKEREVAGRETALKSVEEFRAYRRQINRFVTDQDYIFANFYTGKPLKDASLQFRRLLKKIGLSNDEYGCPYVLYSLRHFYISWRVREGVSIAHISANCGTSPMMIHKHYSHITASEVKSELVKTRNRRKKAI